MATVKFMNIRISDEDIRDVLVRIATILNHDIVVRAGDRSRQVNGTVVQGRLLRRPAVDFTVGGIPERFVFDTIRRHKAEIFDSNRAYQIILHGKFTETGRSQIHVERLASGRGLSWFTEGTIRTNAGQYRRAW